MDREKLVKMLNLFASDKAGEVAAAAHKAHEMVRAANLTWDDVIASENGRAHDPLVEISGQLKRLSAQDQALFLEVKTRYFATGILDASDLRRVAYLKAVIGSSYGDDLPF